MQIDICDAKSHKKVLTLEDVDVADTIEDIKSAIAVKKPSLYVSRQAIRMEPRGKALRDDEKISNLSLPARNAQLYLRDLGPQIGWQTVFLIEYAGPLFIYPIFYFRPSCIYSDASSTVPHNVQLALVCWSIHYAKRLLETLFVHRFSHGTMPLSNLFKNCSYYWGFAAFIAYFVNHPLNTAPDFGHVQVAIGAGLFAVRFSFSLKFFSQLAEAGNFSIHVLLRNLRPAGSKTRVIPMPTANPLTQLYSFVSCPNYTYEAMAWLGFSVMTQSLPAFSFTVVGLAQMTVWAMGKHRAYKKEFEKYPRGRKAIIPFVI